MAPGENVALLIFKLLFRNTKTRIYRTIIMSVLLCDCEAWISPNSEVLKTRFLGNYSDHYETVRVGSGIYGIVLIFMTFMIELT